MLDSAVLETTPLVVSAGILTVRAIVREVFWWRALAQPTRLLRVLSREQQLSSKERRELLALLLAAHRETVTARARHERARTRLQRTKGDVTST